ncbi:hypothetical protein BC629DRAFT_1511283 [Irpex lacteus]|nr:hypothetical protein BC629DRAFT_1511283 [Irpex lacteus]
MRRRRVADVGHREHDIKGSGAASELYHSQHSIIADVNFSSRNHLIPEDIFREPWILRPGTISLCLPRCPPWQLLCTCMLVLCSELPSRPSGYLRQHAGVRRRSANAQNLQGRPPFCSFFVRRREGLACLQSPLCQVSHLAETIQLLTYRPITPYCSPFISAVHTQRPSHTTYCSPIYDSNSQRAHPRGEKMHERKLSRAKA